MQFEDDEPDDGLAEELFTAASAAVPRWRDDDAFEINLAQPLVPAVHQRQSGSRGGGPCGETVSLAGVGGWQYSISRLLQALLLTRYLRCASDFLRAVVFAVSFAVGSQVRPVFLNV